MVDVDQRCIGYSIFPDDGTDLDRLLSYADASMYRSKKKTNN